MGTFAGATNNWLNNTPQGLQYALDNKLYVRNGLVLYLDAGNPLSYPGTGNTWTDLSGNNNNGTLINGPTYSSDNGGSIVFDGVNDYAEKTTSTFLTGDIEATIDTWIYYTGISTSASYNTIVAFGDGPNGGDTFSIGLTDVYRIAISYNGGLNYQTAQNTLVTNTWNHIVVTKTPGAINTTSKIYLNSVLQSASGPANIPNVNSRVIRVGKWTNEGAPYYPQMKCANVKIYNRALSQAEVQQNFNIFKGRYGL